MNDPITIAEMAKLLSMGLTVPNLIFSFAVCYLWFNASKDVYFSGFREASDWLILGVFVGFTGQILDNFYWAFPWTASFLGLNSSTALFESGIYFNIFFRQGLGLVAACFHVISFCSGRDNRLRIFNLLLIGSHLLGVIYVLILLIVKG